MPERFTKSIRDHGLLPALVERFPQLEVVAASKSTLAVASRLIEDMAAAGPGVNVLMTCFQRGEYWSARRERYLGLAQNMDVVALFADLEGPDAVKGDPIAIRLASDAPLANDWIVLAMGPELAVVLCGSDEDGELLDATAPWAGAIDERDRLFDVIVSHDPEVVKTMAGALFDVVDRHEPDRLEALKARHEAWPKPGGDAIARTADQLTTGMLKRVEGLRLAEKLAERRTSQAKTEFLARMGHELRNPLNAILGYAQLLEMGVGEEADNAARISRAGNHLLTLVEEVLDISQVESGRLRVAPEELDVAELILRALELIRTEASARGVQLETAGALSSPVKVHGDRRLIIAILLNLLSNAVKYDHLDGLVRVDAQVDEAWCHITVADGGPGIPADALDRVFEPFERLAGTADRTSGVGLGLSLSRSMAAAIGAQLKAASPPGQGATFTLSLPLTRANAGSVPAARAPGAATG